MSVETPKGKTPWFPRSTTPVRNGEYECVVRVTRSAPLFLWRLQWDGIGFLVPFPMVVVMWRGQTERAAKAQAGDGGTKP